MERDLCYAAIKNENFNGIEKKIKDTIKTFKLLEDYRELAKIYLIYSFYLAHISSPVKTFEAIKNSYNNFLKVKMQKGIRNYLGELKNKENNSTSYSKILFRLFYVLDDLLEERPNKRSDIKILNTVLDHISLVIDLSFERRTRESELTKIESICKKTEEKYGGEIPASVISVARELIPDKINFNEARKYYLDKIRTVAEKSETRFVGKIPKDISNFGKKLLSGLDRKLREQKKISKNNFKT